MTITSHSFKLAWRNAAWAWLALGVFDATQTVISMHAMGMHHAWLTLFVVSVLSWAVWAVFTPVPLVLLRRFRCRRAIRAHGWSMRLPAWRSRSCGQRGPRCSST